MKHHFDSRLFYGFMGKKPEHFEDTPHMIFLPRIGVSFFQPPGSEDSLVGMIAPRTLESVCASACLVLASSLDRWDQPHF